MAFRVVDDDPDGSRLLGDGSKQLVDFGDGTPFLGVGGHVDCAGVSATKMVNVTVTP